MKRVNKVIITVLILIGIFFLVASIAVPMFGKKIVEDQIEQNLKVKATLDSISFGMPFSVNLSHLKIGDLADIKSLSATPNILALLVGKVVISSLNIVEPVINLTQFPDGKLNLPQLPQGGKQPPILITGLNIKDGKIIFSDQKVTQEGCLTIIDKLDAEVAKSMFPPTSLNVKFKIQAALADSKNKTLGNIETSGWIDFGPKNMDAILTLTNLDVVHFAPYYGNFLSTQKLLSAMLDLTADFEADNNDLSVLSNLRLSNLVYAQEEQAQEGQFPSFDFSKNSLDFFTDEKGNLDLEFTVNTKLDDPNISSKQLQKIILSAAAKNLALQNPKQLMNKVNKTIEQFQSIGKELKGLFKEKE